jgi:hypothetical protein
MIINISPQGEIKHIYTENIDLTDLGETQITRASNVEPVGLQWEATMKDGAILGPFNLRSEALAAEVNYLEKHLGTIMKGKSE